MTRAARAVSLLLGLALSACPKPPATAASGGPAAPPPGPAYWLEQVGDVGVVQIQPDGFDALTPNERLLAYHLSLAAIAGDPIAYDQRYDRNLEIKTLLEGIVTHGGGIDPDVLGRIRTYLKLFWIRHGIHDPATFEKTLPPFAYNELLTAAFTAFHAGERFVFTDEDQLRAALEGLAPSIFDPDVDRWSVAKSPPEGEDLLTASACNFYAADVSLSDLDGFTETNALNSRIGRDADGNLVEQVYRTGREVIPAGRYAGPLRRVVRHLREALPYASETQAGALGKLIDWFETGDPQAFDDYNAAWVADDPGVDAILGFVETYGDPRSVKGTWEGIVMFPDRARSATLRALAADAAYFEQRMPWAEAYRRETFDGAVATASIVVTATGDAALLTPVGVSLPNAQALRESLGSKSFWLANVDDASIAAFGDRAAEEFGWDEAEIAEAERCGAAAWRALVAMHEVIGHPSGKVSEALGGDPDAMLREFAGSIEEARADLVAMQFAEDPRPVELGLLPDRECGVAMEREFVRGAMLLLRRLPSDAIDEDHDRGQMMTVRYAIERGAVREESRDGKRYLRIPDIRTWRTVVSELLAELQRIRAEGDYDAARALVETYGARAPEGWRDEARRRAELAGIPAQIAFVPPALEPVRDPTGAIVDVRAVVPVDLESLMLSWSAIAAE